MMYRQALPLVLLFFPLLGACAANAKSGCVVGADCPSGVCNVDGTCGDLTTTSSSSTSGAGGSGGSAGATTGAGGGASSSTTTSSSGAGGSGGGSGACLPNNDGVITQAEAPFAVGIHATFRAAESAPVDTVGVVTAGAHAWDLDKTLTGNPGDHSELVETLPITGQWFAASFAGATYAARLSDAQTLLGVFEVAQDTLLLRGVVSPSGGATATSLSYSPPVKVLSFPIKEGSTWTTTSTVSGTLSGVATFPYTEIYDSKVDAHGTMKTPFSTFPVVRIRTNLTRAGIATSHTFLFVTECFGTIASMVSKDYETVDEFTTAAEVTRLAP